MPDFRLITVFYRKQEVKSKVRIGLGIQIDVKDRHIEIVRGLAIFLVFIDDADKLAIQKDFQ